VTICISPEKYDKCEQTPLYLIAKIRAHIHQELKEEAKCTTYINFQYVGAWILISQFLTNSSGLVNVAAHQSLEKTNTLPEDGYTV
jgi:hypothetical protein